MENKKDERIPSQIDSLSPERKALVAELLRRRTAPAAAETVTASRDEGQIDPEPHLRLEPFPLTDLQQAYLFGRTVPLDFDKPTASRAYVELQAPENFDLARFAKAVNELIEVHEMLRVIVNDDGNQVVLESVPNFEPETSRLAGVGAEDRERALEAIMYDMLEEERPANTWPLFDIRITDGDDRQYIHFTFDLLAVDGGSISILFRDLARLYREPGATTKRSILSFRDFVLAAKRFEESETYQRARDYWFARLEDLPGAPELPLADLERPLERARFVRRKTAIEPSVWTQIKKTSARNGITPTGVLLSAYAEVLGMWSSTDRFLINIPIFNRPPIHPEIEDIVGDFSSVELLEVNRRDGESLLQSMKALQERLWEDLEHRAMDGVTVMRELSRVRRNNRAAVIPYVFTSLLEHGFDQAISEVGEITRSVNQTAQVWLDLHVDEVGGALVIKWDCVEGMFPDGVMDDMLDAYVRLVRELASSEDTWNRVRRDMLPPPQLERRRLTNDTNRAVPTGRLDELFAASAAKHANRAAVIDGAGELSYKDLNVLSSKVAARLQSLGIGRNELVPIIMQKGREQIIAVLGVLQSGAAYLPISPDDPPERIRKLIEIGQGRVVLTQQRIDTLVDWPSDLEVLFVDTVDSWNDSDTQPAPTGGDEDDLAYVLYTSGSTGLPKGVMISHRNVSNRMVDVCDRFEIGTHDRIIGVTALQHDLSIFDIFASVLSGATLVLPDHDRRIDPRHLVDVMSRHRVTLWNSVPAFIELIVDYFDSLPVGSVGEFYPDLRSVFLSGDWIPTSLPDRIRKYNRDTRVVGLGGPTETTVWDICNEDTHLAPGTQRIPYGRPMANAQYHIFNRFLEDCPEWVVGEMYIGGAGLAKGYWKNDDLTDRVFVKHPVSGERLYKSGDMGFFRPDGLIEITGRADNQIKIRGFRVELGEVEAVLEENPKVGRAVVNCFGSNALDRKLVAYVVPKDGESDDDSKGGGLAALGPNVITDPAKRLEFKLAQKGVRSFSASTEAVELFRDAQSHSLELFLERQSHRTFLQSPVSARALGRLMACLGQYQLEDVPFPKYRYPSGGGLYPVQSYVYIRSGSAEGLEGGTYYYDPVSHTLVPISVGVELPKEINTPNNYPIFEESAFAIFLVGDLDAVAPMYGDRLAREFCVLEAGYMGQLLMEVADRESIGLCPIGGVAFNQVEHHFELGDQHYYVHCLVGGLISEEQRKTSSFFHPAKVQSDGDGVAAKDLATELQEYSRDRLPDYMVPSTFVTLEELPLNRNGKVDRAALPEPDTTSLSKSDTTVEETVTETEMVVAGIWKEALAIEHVDVNSNFVDLGGHSLLATRVSLRLAQELDYEINPILVLFQTIRQLARKIDEHNSTAAEGRRPVAAAETTTVPSEEDKQGDGGLLKRIFRTGQDRGENGVS